MSKHSGLSMSVEGTFTHLFLARLPQHWQSILVATGIDTRGRASWALRAWQEGNDAG